MKIKDTLAAWLAFKKTNPTDLADGFDGLNQSTIHRILTGESPDPRHGTLLRIAEALGITPAQLIRMPGDNEPSNVEPVTLGGQLVPLVDYVQAGIFAEVCDPYAMGGGFEFVAAGTAVSRCSFALKITGLSMYPEFYPGDIVIIDPAIKPSPGDLVVAKNGDEEATFKKYRPRGHNERGEELIELVPINEDFPTMRSDVTPFYIIGTMVEHRKFRRA